MIDRSTVLGLAGTVVLLVGVLFAGAGGAVDVFWRTPSLILVVGGTVLATLVAFPAGQFRSLGSVMRDTLYVRSTPIDHVIATLVALSEIARRRGLLVLEKPVEALEDGFLKRGMRMAVDGHEAAAIERVMRTEMETLARRHDRGRAMLESMGRLAPVFGMIGTLLGLVIMLGRMDDPSQIGPGMAVALLTTLYGLVLANVFCLPLARKVAHRGEEETLNRRIIIDGVLGIQAGDHPRVLADKLKAYVPPDILADAADVAKVVAARLGGTAAEKSLNRMKPPMVRDPAAEADRSRRLADRNRPAETPRPAVGVA